MGLSQLNCSELRLKRLCSRSGLLGADKLINFVITEWLNDIKHNQLQSILGGVGPAYSFMQLFQGLKDLFWMPVAQYRQDGRIVRGLQKGAHSFSTSTAMAVLELSNRLVSTMQVRVVMIFYSNIVPILPIYKQLVSAVRFLRQFLFETAKFILNKLLLKKMLYSRLSIIQMPKGPKSPFELWRVRIIESNYRGNLYRGD